MGKHMTEKSEKQCSLKEINWEILELQLKNVVESAYEVIIGRLNGLEGVERQRALLKELHKLSIGARWNSKEKVHYLTCIEEWLTEIARERNDLP